MRWSLLEQYHLSFHNVLRRLVVWLFPIAIDREHWPNFLQTTVPDTAILARQSAQHPVKWEHPYQMPYVVLVSPIIFVGAFVVPQLKRNLIPSLRHWDVVMVAAGAAVVVVVAS